MKKTLVLFGIAIIAFSCKKEESKRCWTCTFKKVGVAPTTKDLCDKSKSEIEEQIREFHYRNPSSSTMECQ